MQTKAIDQLANLLLRVLNNPSSERSNVVHTGSSAIGQPMVMQDRVAM